jgi:hypothetical protein
MSNLAYLLIALGLSVVLSVGMWAMRYRKPKTFMSSIDDFRREMDALGGEGSDAERRRRARQNGRPDPIIPAPEEGDLARRLKEARKFNRTDADDDRYYEER